MTNEEKMALFLDTLTDDQKKSLRLALDTPKEEPVKKTRKQTRGKKPVSTNVEKVEPKKKRRVQKIKMDLDEGDEEILNEEAPERTRRTRARKVPGKPGANEKPCRTESVRIGKKIPDFAKDPDFNRFKSLTAKDEAHWDGKRPKASPRNRVGYVEVKCIKCKQTYEVGIKLGHKRFVCDDCITEE